MTSTHRLRAAGRAPAARGARPAPPPGAGCPPAHDEVPPSLVVQAGSEPPETAAVGEDRSRSPGTSPVAEAMSENELEEHMRRILADLPSVLKYHTHDSRRSPSGFPDWVFCGPSGVLFRELKREAKKPTPAQAAWLSALRLARQDAGVWKPSQLLDGTIARELAKIAGLPLFAEVTAGCALSHPRPP